MEIWENYVRELYDQPNPSETLEVEPEEKVNSEKKGPYVF
jgi:hypothetical protein